MTKERSNKPPQFGGGPGPEDSDALLRLILDEQSNPAPPEHFRNPHRQDTEDARPKTLSDLEQADVMVAAAHHMLAHAKGRQEKQKAEEQLKEAVLARGAIHKTLGQQRGTAG